MGLKSLKTTNLAPDAETCLLLTFQNFGGKGAYPRRVLRPTDDGPSPHNSQLRSDWMALPRRSV